MYHSIEFFIEISQSSGFRSRTFERIADLPAFFDFLISLSQKGLMILLLKFGPTFSKWPKLARILVGLTKSLKVLSKELEH